MTSNSLISKYSVLLKKISEQANALAIADYQASSAYLEKQFHTQKTLKVFDYVKEFILRSYFASKSRQLISQYAPDFADEFIDKSLFPGGRGKYFKISREPDSFSGYNQFLFSWYDYSYPWPKYKLELDILDNQVYKNLADADSLNLKLIGDRYLDLSKVSPGSFDYTHQLTYGRYFNEFFRALQTSRYFAKQEAAIPYSSAGNYDFFSVRIERIDNKIEYIPNCHIIPGMPSEFSDINFYTGRVIDRPIEIKDYILDRDPFKEGNLRLGYVKMSATDFASVNANANQVILFFWYHLNFGILNNNRPVYLDETTDFTAFFNLGRGSSRKEVEISLSKWLWKINSPQNAWLFLDHHPGIVNFKKINMIQK